jgi:hypothetical protein
MANLVGQPEALWNYALGVLAGQIDEDFRRGIQLHEFHSVSVTFPCSHVDYTYTFQTVVSLVCM